MHQELSAERPANKEHQHKVGGGYRAWSSKILVTTVKVGGSPRKGARRTVYDRGQMPRSMSRGQGTAKRGQEFAVREFHGRAPMEEPQRFSR